MCGKHEFTTRNTPGEALDLRKVFTKEDILDKIMERSMSRVARKRGQIHVFMNCIEYHSASFSWRITAPFTYDELKSWLRWDMINER